MIFPGIPKHMANRFLDSQAKYNRLCRFHQSAPADHRCRQGAWIAPIQTRRQGGQENQ
jgi:hypothetical protein